MIAPVLPPRINVRSPLPFVLAAWLAVLVAGLFCFSGCASTPGDRTTIARVAVSYATYKVIENNPDHAPRIVAISQAVREVAGGETFNTVALLDTFIRSQIKWERLSAADTLLAHMLLDEIKRQLIAKVGDGALTSDKLLVVGEVAGWIEDAAKAATPVR